MVFAFAMGCITGFFIAYKLNADYIFWMTLCTIVGVATETVTRYSPHTPKPEHQEKIKPIFSDAPLPKLPKEQKISKKTFKM